MRTKKSRTCESRCTGRSFNFEIATFFAPSGTCMESADTYTIADIRPFKIQWLERFSGRRGKQQRIRGQEGEVEEREKEVGGKKLSKSRTQDYQ